MTLDEKTLVHTKPVKAEKTRDRILDVAARMFRHKGYSDTSVNDIAQAANIRGASLYYHFKSKDDVLTEVLDRGTFLVFEAVRTTVETLPAEASARDRLTIAIRTHLSMLHQHGDYTAANVRVFPQAPPEVLRKHMKLRRAYGDYWIELLRRAQEAGDIDAKVNVRETSMLLLGALNWSTQWFDPKTQDMESVAGSATALLLDGLLKP
ncbi:MAG: TetR family transcriptional regulator [Proteobacteria bacterium]|nr:TetR family transcriptional regulator [Pseudomonadota bacterium]